MLTLAALRQHLAAALDVPEANIGAMLGDLALGGFMAFAESAPVDAVGVAAVILALVANVSPERAAAEAVRLGDFVLAGDFESRTTVDGMVWRATPWPLTGGTVMGALLSAIEFIGSHGTASTINGVLPLCVRLQRGPQGDYLLLEWRRFADSAVAGAYFAPASIQQRRSHSSLSITTDSRLDWSLISHLAMQIASAQHGAAPAHNDNVGVPVIPQPASEVVH